MKGIPNREDSVKAMESLINLRQTLDIRSSIQNFKSKLVTTRQSICPKVYYYTQEKLLEFESLFTGCRVPPE